jgi:hypothetical protein
MEVKWKRKTLIPKHSLGSCEGSIPVLGEKNRMASEKLQVSRNKRNYVLVVGATILFYFGRMG